MLVHLSSSTTGRVRPQVHTFFLNLVALPPAIELVRWLGEQCPASAMDALCLMLCIPLCREQSEGYTCIHILTILFGTDCNLMTDPPSVLASAVDALKLLQQT
jgi:hypothetical protein